LSIAAETANGMEPQDADIRKVFTLILEANLNVSFPNGRKFQHWIDQNLKSKGKVIPDHRGILE
jgi:hypothetical protein